MTRQDGTTTTRARWTTAAALLVGSTLCTAPAAGATAQLLANVRAGATASSGLGAVEQLTPVGDRVVFVAAESSSGRELWTSDGTQLGTELLRDFAPGGESPERLRVLGSTGSVAFLFVEVRNAPDGGVWRTDGTRAGTFPLGFGNEWNDHQFDTVTAAVRGSTLFAAGCTNWDGCEVWRSDGEAAGSVRLALVDESQAPGAISGMTVVAGNVYFVVRRGIAELWRSDGTAAGTAAVGLDGIYPNTDLFTAVGSRLLFVGWSEAHEWELYGSDGTAAGTVRLTSFAAHEPFERTQFLRVLGGVAYFILDDVVGGTDLWRSDGTPAGTRRVTDFGFAAPFPWDFREESVALLGQRLLFPASDGLSSGLRLWTSRGTPATAAVLTGCPGGCPAMGGDEQLVAIGPRIVFAAHDPSSFEPALWSTDGTGPGTQPLSGPRLCSDCFDPPRIAVAGGRGYFIAYRPDAPGLAVWTTDGTAAGTRALATIGGDPYGAGSFEAVPLAAKALFGAKDGAAGAQLWSTDGTAEGTAPLSVVRSSEASSQPFLLTPLGGQGILFSADDGTRRALWSSDGTPGAVTLVPGTETSPSGYLPVGPRLVRDGVVYVRRGDAFSHGAQLWRTDGSAAGTRQLTSFAPGGGVGDLVAFAGEVLFSVSDPAGGASLWSTDGTVAGTAPLVDLPPDTGSIRYLTAVGNELYFVAHAGSHRQVWRSDGTAAGTRVLTAFDTYALEEDPSFTRRGAHVYFRAGASYYATPLLWRTDGTAAGTVLVFAGQAVTPATLSVSDLTLLGDGLLHFANAAFAGNTPRDAPPRALYRSDGTPAGTVELARLTPPSNGYDLQDRAEMTVLGGQAFFIADDGEHGEELWTTDGTAAGTRLVHDLVPGPSPSHPRGLTVAGGRLFFTATDGVHGIELWESDGTAAGTRMVQDLAPGGASSAPEELTANGASLYFTADDGVKGREVWTLQPGGPGCQATSTTLCLGNGRYRVDAHWRDFAGNSGAGRAEALTTDTGYFWFFDDDNVEVILKVLDGRGVNGHVWVFYGALSSVEYTLTVTDAETGAARRYVNRSGKLGSVADTIAFGPRGAAPLTTSVGPPAHGLVAAEAWRETAVAKATCVASSTRLCLNGGRFAVEAQWTIPAGSGFGQALPLTADTGYFWFFHSDNVELVLKVLDGRPVNGKFWVFYGALSDVDYTIKVTDTETGRVKEYRNPAGRLASAADVDAF